MKIALAQINTTVGDLAGNAAKILDSARRAQAEGADVVLFPELTITGYPPRDLLLKKDFIDGKPRNCCGRLGRRQRAHCDAGRLRGPEQTDPGPRSDQRGRAAAKRQDRRHAQSRSLLPTYDVFDEDRYFEPGEEMRRSPLAAKLAGVTICEDIWNDEDFWPQRRYRANPVADLLAAGAGHVFNISASPWNVGKEKFAFPDAGQPGAQVRRPVAFCNLVGGNDELVFDGGSLVFNAGRGIDRARQGVRGGFCGGRHRERRRPWRRRAVPDEENVYKALVLGLRDYFHKCGFKSAVLGLSGGIDSAVVACLAAAALGAEHVRGVSLPSQFSSAGQPGRRAASGRAPGHPLRGHSDSALLRMRSGHNCRAGLRWAGRGHDRGKPPGAVARGDADGVVQQVRFAVVDDRQQKRTGRRLLHALRRHVRRAWRSSATCRKRWFIGWQIGSIAGAR